MNFVRNKLFPSQTWISWPVLFIIVLTIVNGLIISQPTNPRGASSLGLFLAPVPVAQAAEDQPADPSYGLDATATAAKLKTSKTNLPTIIGTIINVILGLLGVVFFVLMIYGGFLWMTGSRGGEKKDINKAKGIITNAVVGLAIVLAAYAVTNFVMKTILDATIGTGTPQ